MARALHRPLERSSTDLERIWWTRAGSTQREPIPASALCWSSGGSWPSVRVEEHTSAPGELPAGSFAGHLLVLNVGSAYRLDLWWSGAPPPSDHILLPGNFAFLPAGMLLSAAWRDPATCVVVELSRGFVEGLDEGGTGLHPCVNRRDAFVSHVVLAFRNLGRDLTQRGAAYGETLGAVLAGYLLSNSPGWGNGGRPEGGVLSSPRMRRVCEYVDANLEQEISLLSLAQECGTSVFHFARLFKRRTGVAPHQFIVQRRLERARSLLGNADLSVGEVASRCGFAQQSHFATTFRRAMGVSPTTFRRLL